MALSLSINLYSQTKQEILNNLELVTKYLAHDDGRAKACLEGQGATIHWNEDFNARTGKAQGTAAGGTGEKAGTKKK